ncbi:MAG: LysM peptidoglycan-binding domain-containing protein [Planctomycetota bacterium]|jgi:nucleoid-associated protein YgaU
MGNFEKLGILVIIILVVVIMVLTIWGGPVPAEERDPTDDPNALSSEGENHSTLSGRVTLDPRSSAEPEETQSAFAPPDERPEEEARTQEPPEEPAAESEREDIRHVMKKDESFYSLAQHYYGNGKYFKEIRDANPSLNPTAVPIGATIVIPHPDRVLHRDAPASSSPDRGTPAPDVYVVKKGDSLAKISRVLFGSEARWKAIYDANRDLIGSDPDRLQLDMRLRIPR